MSKTTKVDASVEVKVEEKVDITDKNGKIKVKVDESVEVKVDIKVEEINELGKCIVSPLRLPRIFQGKGADFLKQFNGFYQITSSTYVNIQFTKYWKPLIIGGAKKIVMVDELQMCFKITPNLLTWITLGNITFKDGVAVLKFKGFDFKTKKEYDNVLKFSRSPFLYIYHSDVGGNTENGYPLTYVNGRINGFIVANGVNYLNYIPLSSWVGNYQYSVRLTPGKDGLPVVNTQSMEVGADSWTLNKKKLDTFNYYSSMFTLKNEIEGPDGRGVFLGTSSSGFISYLFSDQYNYLLSNFKMEHRGFKVVNVSSKAAHHIAEFTGFYTFKDNTNYFFCIKTSLKYDNNDNKYAITITYSVDGKTIVNIIDPTVIRHKSGDLELQWARGEGPGPAPIVVLYSAILSRPKFNKDTGVLTRIKFIVNDNKNNALNGVNTTNDTPLSYFASIYKYQTPLGGKQIKNPPILQITSDEKIILTIKSGCLLIPINIDKFEWTGSMYLLSFDAGSINNSPIKYTFMMGVRRTGLCFYCFRQTGLQIEMFFMNAFPPMKQNQKK